MERKATMDRVVKPRHPPGMLCAVDVPWKEDWSLDEGVFRRHVRHLISNGFKWLYVMGTAGEGYAVSDSQFKRVVDVFVEEMSGPGLKPQVGVISLSTTQVAERIRYARSRGVRSFQVSLPSWGAVSDREMLAFFRTVCGPFPDCDFLHYNLGRTKRVLTGEDYRPIIESVPNLVATKQSTYDFGLIRGWVQEAPELQHFFLQHDYASGCLYGECSLLCALAGLFPKLTHDYYKAGQEKDLKRAFEVQSQFMDIGESLFGHVKTTHMDGAYDKFVAWLIDPSFPRRLLPPYEAFPDTDAETGRRNYEARYRHIG